MRAEHNTRPIDTPRRGGSPRPIARGAPLVDLIDRPSVEALVAAPHMAYANVVSVEGAPWIGIEYDGMKVVTGNVGTLAAALASNGTVDDPSRRNVREARILLMREEQIMRRAFGMTDDDDSSDSEDSGILLGHSEEDGLHVLGPDIIWQEVGIAHAAMGVRVHETRSLTYMDTVQSATLPTLCKMKDYEFEYPSHKGNAEGSGGACTPRTHHVALRELEFQTSGVGFRVWDASVVLACALASAQKGGGGIVSDVAGMRVLELGSGIGLAGLFASALGASHVVLSDCNDVLLENLYMSAHLNAPPPSSPKDGGDGQASKRTAYFPIALNGVEGLSLEASLVLRPRVSMETQQEERERKGERKGEGKGEGNGNQNLPHTHTHTHNSSGNSTSGGGVQSVHVCDVKYEHLLAYACGGSEGGAKARYALGAFTPFPFDCVLASDLIYDTALPEVVPVVAAALLRPFGQAIFSIPEERVGLSEAIIHMMKLGRVRVAEVRHAKQMTPPDYVRRILGREAHRDNRRHFIIVLTRMHTRFLIACA